MSTELVAMHGLIMGLQFSLTIVTSSMQVHAAQAQRASRVYQTAVEHACYTGFTGS